MLNIDLSPKMISLAQKKAASQGYQIEFRVMDAAFPQLPHNQFDVIVCRHLLWVLPEPPQVLHLSDNLNLWGKDVIDERYAVIADLT